jgi:hypothetical protein
MNYISMSIPPQDLLRQLGEWAVDWDQQHHMSFDPNSPTTAPSWDPAPVLYVLGPRSPLSPAPPPTRPSGEVVRSGRWANYDTPSQVPVDLTRSPVRPATRPPRPIPNANLLAARSRTLPRVFVAIHLLWGWVVSFLTSALTPSYKNQVWSTPKDE